MRAVFAFTLVVCSVLAGIPAASATLYFEQNSGQFAADWLFVSRSGDSGIGLSRGGMTLTLPSGRQVVVAFAGASAAARVEGRAPDGGVMNYFIGDRRMTGIPRFARVRYSGVFPGVDVEYYGEAGRLEYDVIVHPGADLRSVQLRYEGAERIAIAADGALRVTMPWGELVETPPRAYQVVSGRRQAVEAAFEVAGDGVVGFRAGAHDPALDLVIDPTLLYSSYIGGTDVDSAHAIAVGADEHMYVAGRTASSNTFPVSPWTPVHGGGHDVFVTKLTPGGSNVVFSTFIGGSGDDMAFGLVLDSNDGPCVVGMTDSTDFPLRSARQAALGGGLDAFVLQLGPSGSNLVFSTYLGGETNDGAFSVALDGEGRLYMAGVTESTNFPVRNAYQPNLNVSGEGGMTQDVFLVKWRGTNIEYSTYLGGNSYDGFNEALLVPQFGRMGLAVDTGHCAYIASCTVSTNFPVTANAFQKTNESFFAVAGINLYMDAFLTKFASNGLALEYSTLLGGYENEHGHDVIILSNGVACVVGETGATNFPVTLGALKPAHVTAEVAWDGFLTVVDTAVGTQLVYSTYFGADDGNDQPWAVRRDADSNLWLVGYTDSTNFPVTNAVQATIAGEPDFMGDYPYDVFAAKLAPAATSIVFATYLGGVGKDYGYGLALDAHGVAYLCGMTQSTNFPVLGALQPNHNLGSDVNQADGFVAMMAWPLPVPLLRFTEAAGRVDLAAQGYPSVLYRVEAVGHISDQADWQPPNPYTNWIKAEDARTTLVWTNLIIPTDTVEVVRFYRVAATNAP
ncbi:MAG TPA: SBBP repeat-containing protein [Kiritimatiellia bacterium]|nr:SBBP repeat-containing protein [Kiritimatiellia bacterium]HRZ13402.1 SBBP repeat-containing protein [Kiritimatiellia bacterium]HSA18958.1 SBBP repeat-containing protein [Kiritimatiellia bacterium]